MSSITQYLQPFQMLGSISHHLPHCPSFFSLIKFATLALNSPVFSSLFFFSYLSNISCLAFRIVGWVSRWSPTNLLSHAENYSFCHNAPLHKLFQKLLWVDFKFNGHGVAKKDREKGVFRLFTYLKLGSYCMILHILKSWSIFLIPGLIFRC